MQRLFGAIFVLTGCLGVGLSYMENHKQKIAFVEMWETILDCFLEEIVYKKQSLALAAREIGERINGEEGECFKRIYDRLIIQNQNGFAEVWMEEWNTYNQKKSISSLEKKLILEFANITGFEEEKIQIKWMEDLQTKWRKVRLELLEGQQERKKIVWTLSACSGVMLILILI